MAKVYEFPTKKELPPIVKDALYDIAKTYVNVLDYAFLTALDEDPSMEELDELKDMILDELMAALDVALFESTFKYGPHGLFFLLA